VKKIVIKGGNAAGEETPHVEYGWPQYFDEPGAPPGDIVVTFKDGGTRWNDTEGEFEDIPGLTQQTITNQWTGGPYEFRNDDPFYVVPKDTTVKIYGGDDAKVSASVWEEEYDEENTEIWNRKPLANLDSDMLETSGGRNPAIGGRFLMSGEDEYRKTHSIYNIRLELLTPDGTTKASINPEAYWEDEAESMKMSQDTFGYIDGGEVSIYPLSYENSKMIPGKFGIKVTELATKSFAHYSNGTSSYAYDWIEGIYFCPFDTTDSTNFKISKVPTCPTEENDVDESEWGYSRSHVSY
jgi:hypothetical protein